MTYVAFCCKKTPWQIRRVFVPGPFSQRCYRYQCLDAVNCWGFCVPRVKNPGYGETWWEAGHPRHPVERKRSTGSRLGTWRSQPHIPNILSGRVHPRVEVGTVSSPEQEKNLGAAKVFLELQSTRKAPPEPPQLFGESGAPRSMRFSKTGHCTIAGSLKMSMRISRPRGFPKSPSTARVRLNTP